MPAPLKVRRQSMGRMRDVLLVLIRQPGLTAIRARHPAKHVVERPILHHDDDYVIDPRTHTIRQRGSFRSES
jgi:hypothetical protein